VVDVVVEMVIVIVVDQVMEMVIVVDQVMAKLTSG
jgi:hypothetical protein